jgi:hypothetical protein
MLQGYFQSAKYFGDHREEMREMFHFRPEVRQWAENFFSTRGLFSSGFILVKSGATLTINGNVTAAMNCVITVEN